LSRNPLFYRKPMDLGPSEPRYFLNRTAVMQHATEYMPVTGVIQFVLWVEVIVYLSVAAREIFDDLHRKPPAWVWNNKRLNTVTLLQDGRYYKTHAVFCLLLGLVALNALIEGQINRLEIEFLFVSLSAITGLVFCIMAPSFRSLPLMLIAPEIYLFVLMSVFYSDMIRNEVLAICVLLILWGVFVCVKRCLEVDGSQLTIRRFLDDKKEYDSMDRFSLKEMVKDEQRAAGRLAGPEATACGSGTTSD